MKRFVDHACNSRPRHIA